MFKKYKGILILVLLAAFILNFAAISAPQVRAEDFNLDTEIDDQLDEIKKIGLPGKEKSEERVLEVVTDTIRALLGLMALIFLIIILVAGFRWMTSGGNEEKIGKSKKLIGNALIGILIIFFAYVITSFVFNIFSDGGW